MKTEEQIFCIIDCRVSDPQQLKGGSLKDQEAAGRYLAQKNGWIVDQVFRKPHSATTNERDDIEDALSYIRQRKQAGIKISKFITKNIDRFTRMGGVEYWYLKEKLEQLSVELVDTTGIIQPKKNTLSHLGEMYQYPWSVYSPSEAAETMEAYKGKAEVRDILTRLVGAEIRLVQEGYSVRRAPDGLKNKRILVEGKNKIVREAGERAYYFQKMYKLLAEGVDYNEVVSQLNAMGFRTQIYKRWDRRDKEHPKVIGKKGGNPLTVKQLQRYVLQTEYAGISYEKWTKHQPIKMQQFNGIVSIDTFNKANRGKIYIKLNCDNSIEILHNFTPWGKVRRLKDNQNFPLKFIRCSKCGKPMLASASKSKSGAHPPRYHCGNTPSRTHSYYSVPKHEFENNVRNFVESLKFEESFLNSFEMVLNDTFRTREKEIISQSSDISLNVSNLKALQVSALDALMTAQSSITRKKLEDKIDDLEFQIQQAQNKRAEIEVTEKDIKAFVRYAKYLMEHPSELLINPHDIRIQRTLFGLVFDEIPTYQEIINGTPKLSLIFKVSEDFKKNKSQLVTLPGIEPGFRA